MLSHADLPMGFAMALAQNIQAMEVFTSLTDIEQQKLIDGTHDIQSKEQMRAYVKAIADYRK